MSEEIRDMTAVRSLEAGPPVVLALTSEAREVAATRSNLRHSWLENQLLNREAGIVALRHRETSKAHESFKDKIKAGGDFERSILAARTLCETFESRLAPASLLELEPLASLSQDVRGHLAAVLGRLYRKCVDIAAIKRHLLEDTTAFDASFRSFVEVWYRSPAATEDAVKESFAILQIAGRKLHESLGRIPAGVVLP